MVLVIIVVTNLQIPAIIHIIKAHIIRFAKCRRRRWLMAGCGPIPSPPVRPIDVTTISFIIFFIMVRRAIPGSGKEHGTCGLHTGPLCYRIRILGSRIKSEPRRDIIRSPIIRQQNKTFNLCPRLCRAIHKLLCLMPLNTCDYGTSSQLIPCAIHPVVEQVVPFIGCECKPSVGGIARNFLVSPIHKSSRRPTTPMGRVIVVQI